MRFHISQMKQTLTGPEKAYHPLNFHTKFCEAFCRGAKCKYGEYCAFAHDELQQPSKYEEEMKQKLYPTKSRLQIKEFLPEMSEEVVQPPKILRSQLFEEAADSSRRVVCLPLTCLEVKVLQNPKMTLWKQIKDVELESMCQFQLKWNEMDAVTLQIQGPEQNVRDAQLEVERHLRPMRPKYDETKRKGYHARVIELLSNRLKTDGPEPFTDSKNSDLVSLRIDRQKEEVEVWSLNLPGVRKPQEVFGQIDWWVRDSRYDTLLTCEGCRDECTRDEGRGRESEIGTLSRRPESLVWKTIFSSWISLLRYNKVYIYVLVDLAECLGRLAPCKAWY